MSKTIVKTGKMQPYDERLESLEKRVATLEKQIKGQPLTKKKIMGYVGKELVNYSE